MHPQNKPTVAAVPADHPIDTSSAREATPARAQPSRLHDAAAFLRAFLARPTEVASVVPSSVRLERRILRLADLASARCVVELGPGTGGTTRALLAALPPQARLLAIELNTDLAQRLQSRIRDPRLIVHHGSALALAEILERWHLPAPDAAVSGIPFSILPTEIAQGVAAAIRDRLAPGGRFVAYQFRDHVAGYLTPLMGPPRREWEWFNAPPVRVFRWVKPLSSGRGDTDARSR